MSARGVLYVHSAPAALCPHVEWAVAGVVGVPVKLDWGAQPAAPGAHRAELNWQGAPGTSGAIASALNGWQRLRFEVTEEPTPGCDGVRYSYTPTLGIFTAVTSASGEVLVSEARLRNAVERAAAQEDIDLAAELDRLTGREWDEELEPFRYAGDGAPVRWLHAAG
ncbi:DUF3145 domain-containing protein [Streptomonospora sp. S1-112]|uniref:DUF3145 domain-containing protein n=1 Tax=Streptomonospora mangrovi TaxID=2883123 RepID=A0A9X3NQE9_9ACTN|nr:MULTISPECIES: DUF3145 domain-containing protein [Streptomonospora]MBV2363643.1 DUF3145 domain-containing protein [Streptomonospora nanhaiensis]MBX9390315.1 DUF3145 domain-containing protein [Streptomonospora nanhaiensis]MDA0566079.1 DUF3145 domain-containing protein [Streptomonospora mangrovi]